MEGRSRDVGGRTTCAITDATQNVTRYLNNWYGQPLDEWLAGATLHRTRQYDWWGNLILATDCNQRTIRYNYDAMGNRTGEQWLGDPQGYHASFAYNPLGQLLTATDNNADGSEHSSLITRYDTRQRPDFITETVDVWQATAAFDYDYDLAGNLISRASSFGEALVATNAYRYDGLHRTIQIQQTGPDLTAKFISYTYDGLAYGFDRYEAGVADPSKFVAHTDVAHYADGRVQIITHTDDPAEGNIVAFESARVQVTTSSMQYRSISFG